MNMVVTDIDSKPQYIRQKPRMYRQFSRVNWQDLGADLDKTASEINVLYSSGSDVHSLWDHFEASLVEAVDRHVPSKVCRKHQSTPWINCSVHRLLRRKKRLYKKAKRNKNWSKYYHFQKECRRSIRKAEWEYVNSKIKEGLANNSTKQFWRYIKSKRQDNVGVSPLKDHRKLVSDTKSKLVFC